MNFEFSEQQLSIQEAVSRICRNFGDDYWLARDTDGHFPEEFVHAITEGGWLGIAMPEEFGGSGLGVSEALVLAHTIARSGAGMSGASAVHLNLFGPNGDNYVINGQKLWTTTAQTATKILLIARTTPLVECERPTDGLSLFFTDLDRDKIEVRLIEKMGRKAVDSNSLFIDNLIVPAQDLIGEEGGGWKCLLHGLNPERILIAAEAVGLGQAALERASNYARERVVFDRTIGKNQAIQHPLAVNWMELEAAMLMVFKAAAIYDSGEPCGAESNAAKYLAAEAALSACQRSVLTHGGMGYAKEYHVERYLREIMIPVIAPVSQEMIKSFIGERVLGQEKSY